MQSVNDRFKSAPWMSLYPEILIGGTGGIGSNSLYCLAKSIPGMYYIVDDDYVVEHNVGTQFFRKSDVGKQKVKALQVTINEYTNSTICPVNTKIDIYSFRPITIAAFDNMTARKFLFDVWKKEEKRELFIDGRLRASYYEIYCVTKGREEMYEATLFNDGEAEEGPCTFKQTAYFGMLIGARITQMVANFLTNKVAREMIAEVPFSIKEVGEAVYMEINTPKSESDAETVS